MTIRPLKRGLRTYLEHDDRRVSFGPWPRGKPGGVLIHTTGGGIIKMCERLGITPGACVDRVYGNPGMSVAHVAVLPDGEAVQCVAWDKRAPHAGVSAAERKMLLDGSWTDHVTDEAEAQWRKRWPRMKSPQHIFPTTSPNDWYVGIETVQGSGAERFTPAQYATTAELVVMMERMFGFVASGNRLVTHEDVQPFSRWDAHGGWDPGVIRAKPTYDWPRLLATVFDGRRAWTKTHLGESPLNKAEAHRLAHKLRDPKFYTARTKRAVNSGCAL